MLTEPSEPPVISSGCHGARRGTYRIVYRIDEDARIVHVLDVDHRSDIYHQPTA
jgi:mRNA-degrading endonuclease RelE of RelBE toxin-antitoxin system